MKAALGFLLLTVISPVALGDIGGECDMAGFYLELGCSVANTSQGQCPDSFTCPDLHPDPSMCYYKGVGYSDRSTIPQAIVSNPCSQACRCETTPEPRFECAAVDCFETADRDLKNCVRTSLLDECCSVGTVCGKDEISKLKTCDYDGNTYREGESFEPKNTRKTCICTPQFNGSIEDPTSCRDVNCGIEMHYQDRIMNKCAPVFVGNKMGCPIDFVCPSNTTVIVPGVNMRDVREQCVFGNTTLSVGDEVTTGDACTQCVCQVPPFVACARRLTSQEECARG